MRKLKVNEIQEIQVEILKKVASFCDKNKIAYFLGCGTLCGAIVENGFFAWDNDVDILMPRDEYEKFIKLFSYDGLNLLTCEKKDYYYPFAKVVDNRTIAYECKNDIDGYGVFIDIFPLDGVPNKFYLYMIKPIKYLMLSKWGCYLKKRNLFIKVMYKIISFITKPIPANYFAKILNNICRKYSIKDYKKSGIVVHYRKECELVDSKIFDKRVKVLFEGNKFYAPYRYDDYLKSLYGDYFVEDEHETKEFFRAFWKKG